VEECRFSLTSPQMSYVVSLSSNRKNDITIAQQNFSSETFHRSTYRPKPRGQASLTFLTYSLTHSLTLSRTFRASKSSPTRTRIPDTMFDRSLERMDWIVLANPESFFSKAGLETSILTCYAYQSSAKRVEEAHQTEKRKKKHSDRCGRTVVGIVGRISKETKHTKWTNIHVISSWPYIRLS